eukprot:TRINITY_DN6866_c0_g1_i2.p5 TRINITY_DN6866_c0_g1~~TRINITY_DN6866_c0_g1_i2.p5  ORF type:complete len:120 (+),score=12.20 TRINITY_DN6866_c0_g1_i2:818-1177(+)
MGKIAAIKFQKSSLECIQGIIIIIQIIKTKSPIVKTLNPTERTFSKVGLADNLLELNPALSSNLPRMIAKMAIEQQSPIYLKFIEKTKAAEAKKSQSLRQKQAAHNTIPNIAQLYQKCP